MMKQPLTIVGIGEVLWDVLPAGPRLGGAPANFACHAPMLGAEAYVVSQVGNDPLGLQAIAALGERGVLVDFVRRSDNQPTGTVDVVLDAAGKPEYVIHQNAAWDSLSWSEALSPLAAKTDAVSFGTLGQRGDTARATIRRFLQATRPDSLRIFDVNLRQQFYNRRIVLDSLELANVLKLSDEELPAITQLCDISAQGLAALDELRERFGLSLVALTRGAAGAVLHTARQTSDHPGISVKVRDTVGAGDAFSAAMTLGLLAGRELNAINEHACRVAAFVCSQPGATPSLPADLQMK